MATQDAVAPAREYVVLHGGVNNENATEKLYEVIGTVEAMSSDQATRKIAETLPDDQLERGVTLIAISARNWNSGRHTLKAETTRRIRSA